MYSGSDWIKRQPYGKEISPLGEQAADLLGDVFLGIYHMNESSLRRVEWSNPQHISVTISRELATFDGDELTRLVLLAHDRKLRVSVEGIGPRYMRLMIHSRPKRTGAMHERCPTIEDHIKILRTHYEEVEGCPKALE